MKLRKHYFTITDPDGKVSYRRFFTRGAMVRAFSALVVEKIEESPESNHQVFVNDKLTHRWANDKFEKVEEN